MTALLVIGIALGLGPSCSSKKPTGSTGAVAEKPPPTVVVVDQSLLQSGRVKLGKVERREPRGETRVPGEVTSGEAGMADVGALVPGRVASLEVGEGSRVKRGQVLAWIDAPEVARATADVLRARARAEVTARKLQRQHELKGGGATSQSAVEDAALDELAARVDLAAARTLLLSLGGAEPPANGSADVVPARSAVRAPIDGVVRSHGAVLGGSVTPEKSLFRIIAGEAIVVLAHLPETAAAPARGTVAQIRPRDKAAATCTATVSGDVGAVDDVTRTVDIRLEPAASCKGLVPGAYVDVVFESAGQPAPAAPLVVPREAIVDVRGATCVFVSTDEQGSFSPRPVRVGGSEGDDVVVEAGVVEGESIAIAGALLLKGELMRKELGGGP